MPVTFSGTDAGIVTMVRNDSRPLRSHPSFSAGELLSSSDVFIGGSCLEATCAGDVVRCLK